MSQETKFTPGPWKFEADMDGDHAIWGSNDTLLAVTDGWKRGTYQVKRTREEDEANAHLMAASPDMVELLLKLADEFACTANAPNENCAACEIDRVLRLALGEVSCKP